MPKREYKSGICFSIEDSAIIRGSEHATEKNDCTVRALKAVCGVPYSDAHNLCRSLGRRLRHGMTGSQLLHMLEFSHVYGYKVTRIALPNLFGNMLGRALMFCRHGRYLVITTHHAIACLDGTLHDTMTSGPNSRVTMILKFTPTSEWEAKAGA